MLKASTQASFCKHITIFVGILFVTSPVINLTPLPVEATPSTSYTKQAKGRVPGRRRGGARRGDCPATAKELTALIPETEISTQALPETYVGGSTIAEHPTFWVYVPYTLTADLTGEFILQDDTGQNIYRIASTDFPTQVTPGIVSISLPSTTAPLKIGKVYQWYFKLNCGMETPMYVQGGIERIPLDANLARQLAKSTPQQQVNLYMQNNLWYDALTTLARLHRTNPTDPKTQSAWINLLRSVGLEDIAVK